MRRFGSSDGEMERGDVIYDTQEEELRRVTYARNDSVSLTPHLKESAEIDGTRRFDSQSMVDDIRSDGTERWELVAEPVDDVRLNRSLLYAFVDATPAGDVSSDSAVDVSMLSESQFRSIVVHEWATYHGQLTERGSQTVQYFHNLRDSPIAASPEERVDEIGISGFVKRANRYDKPVVLDAILAIIDRGFPEAEITAYKSDTAYVSVDGRADKAAELLRVLHGHGFAACFREDERYDIGVNPTKLTVDTTVEPRTGDRAGASQSVKTNIHRV